MPRQLHRLFNVGTLGTISDAELLERFVSRHDEAGEAAFEELVIRHGPMVLRVCRSLLHDSHNAEDAFQAVFLALASRAGSIRRNSSVASWLFGVAHRVAVHGRRRAARLRAVEQLAAERASESYLPSENDPDWEILHEEVQRLPEGLRAPVVLCYLQGLSYAEAALRLGLSAVAIQGRLARARQRLRTRLIRRGVTVPAAGLAAGAASPAHAAVPLTLIRNTVRVALGFMAGNTAAMLARGVLNSMMLNQLRVVTVLSCLALGCSYWAWHAFGATLDGNARTNPGQAVAKAPASARKATTTQPAVAYGMAGSVRLEETGEPVPGATIQVLIGGSGQDHRAAARTARSGADGRFTVDVPPGSARAWTLTAPVGYLAPVDPQMFESFAVSRDEPIQRKDYVVRRGTVWDFRITRSHGAKPLPGLVTASDQANSFWSAVDDAGRVRLTLPTGPGRVKASARESVMAAEWVPMTLEWQSGFRPDAVTSVTKLQGAPARYLLTDHSGKTATFSGTDKGRAAPRIDGGKLVVEVTLPESKPTACGDLTGNVIDTSGQPVAGASVALGWAGENGMSIMSVDDGHHALTDAHGNYRLRSLPRFDSMGKPATIWLSVTKEGLAGADTKSFRFQPGAGDAPHIAQTVVLARGVSVSGTVVDPYGRPLAGAWVEPGGSFANRVKFTKTDDAGRFTIRDLPIGLVGLRVDYGTLMAESQCYAVGDAAPLKVTLHPLPDVALSQARSDAARAARDRTRPLALGTPAPEWESGAWSDGRTRRLADYRGKVVILNFWGTGCVPSLGALLSLEKLRARFELLGVVFLTLHTPGEDEKTFRKVLEMKRASLIFAIDRDRKRDADFDKNGITGERYGVRTYPTLVMIDRRGNVAFHSGGVGAAKGVAAMKALGKSMGLDVDKSKPTEADARRLWEAFFDREIAKVLNRR
jgi:RNA polymerase sigma factor (sigma-70 family)